MKNRKTQTIVFDTETTGLLLHERAPIERQPHIIEFAAVVLSDGKVLLEDSFRINPGQDLSAEITKITGLTTEDVRSEPTFQEQLPRIIDLFRGCDKMIAHNLPFDQGMLSNDLRRFNITDFPWPPKGLCTVELFRPKFGYRPSLKVLYAHSIGKPLDQKHRALDDVHRLVEIVLKEELWKL